MLSSLGAMLRISLRRSRADWPIVASAGLICLLAATLLAAGSIYGSAVSIAGLHRVLAEAPVDEAHISVSSWVAPGATDEADAAVTAELEHAFGPVGGRIVRLAETGTFALPDQPTGAVRDLAILGAVEGLRDHATLLRGSWPEDVASDRSVIRVAVSEGVAERLGLELGERLALDSRIETDFSATVEISGTFRIVDPGGPFWWGDPQAVDGHLVREPFDTHGPFYAAMADLATRTGAGDIRRVWRALPTVAAIGVDDVGGLRTRTADLKARLEPVIDGGVVETGLPEILDRAERSLLVSRTGVLLLSLQLVVLAAYAVLLSASLLVEHRRVDTAMLRSRGAGTARIVALATIEGLVLVVPAVLLGPWLAALLLRMFNLTGPLADIGLTIEPAVSASAYVAAAAAGILCLLALTVPALRSARSYASVHGTLARADTRGIAQRLGLDIALLAVAAIGLWQLRHYGAPLTRSVQGVLGLDPLLVAVPALGLLAGAILALRIVPLLATLIERATTRRRSLVPSLGARQLSRRPLRYTRAALLLMLAMAIGVFAVSYTRTWATSQHDQAAFQAGADLRVVPDSGGGSLPRWALAHTYVTLPGVTAALPVDRETVPTTRASRTSQLLAVDASIADSVIALRPDLAEATLAELMAPLLAGRQAVETVRLPGEPRQLRLSAEVAIRVLEAPRYDEATGEEVVEPAALDAIAGWPGFRLSIVVRDAHGLLHRFDGGSATIDPGPHEMVVPLGEPVEAGPSSFAYPIELLAVELSVGLPAGLRSTDATITVGALETAGRDGAWRSTSLDLPAGWRSTAEYYGRPEPVGSGIRGPSLVAVVGGPGLPVLEGSQDPFESTTSRRILTFAPTGLDRLAGQVTPVVASDRFLEVVGADPGDEVALVFGGERRRVLIGATVRAFPGTRPVDPIAVVDLATLSLLRFDASGAVAPPDEWWLAVADGSTGSVAEALAAPPIDSRSVVSQADLGRSLATDPVALGIIGALAIGFVAAALFAVVGFIVSAAVSARERVTEFALLRALGLSSGQLSFWLSLENAVLASVSLLAGTALGLVIAWVVLPFITVTQGAATPYPPVEIEVPWSVIAVLLAAGVIALGATVVGLAWLLPRIGLASVMRMSED